MYFILQKDEIQEVEFRNGEREKLVKFRIKKLLQIAREKFVIKLVPNKNFEQIKIGTRNKATVFITPNRGYFKLYTVKIFIKKALKEFLNLEIWRRNMKI